MPKKRFTNVAEAFEGMLEEELDGDSSDYGAYGQDATPRDEHQVEKLIVTEEDAELYPPVSRKKRSSTARGFRWI